jgi:hypothetical protein
MSYSDEDDYRGSEDDLCEYCGDNYTSSTYCSGWCRYRAEVRGPMKRATMQKMIRNGILELLKEKNKIKDEVSSKIINAGAGDAIHVGDSIENEVIKITELILDGVCKRNKKCEVEEITCEEKTE